MIRILMLAFIFLNPSNGKSAGVIFLGSSPDVSVYVYPDTVKNLGAGLAQGWSLYDFKSKQYINKVFLNSVKSFNILDCENNRIGILNDIYYSGKGGRGEVVWNGAIGMADLKWQYIAPHSLSELKYDFICEMAKSLSVK